MRILIVGSGGREHALAWKLAQEHEIFASPGNPGIAKVVECFGAGAEDVAALRALADRLTPDLVVVGPEAPLIGGLADALRLAGHAVFGPGRDGARLEESKAFSKKLMEQSGVPTARGQSFTSPSEAVGFARQLCEAGRGAVVKASGAALG
ncbi:MAG TPA: phosphoribosylamine--glycine ligase, partial [Fimbriimonadaceae bacterium]|nr:phosphoribosylamine--glycine ligase [Fimbriimonadaceae bacterium]